MKKIKIESFEKVNHKIRDEMSSKPYIAFFEVGKDENKIVEVKLTMSTVDMLELLTPYIFLFSQKCQNHWKSTFQKRKLSKFWFDNTIKH